MLLRARGSSQSEKRRVGLRSGSQRSILAAATASTIVHSAARSSAKRTAVGGGRQRHKRKTIFARVTGHRETVGCAIQTAIVGMPRTASYAVIILIHCHIFETLGRATIQFAARPSYRIIGLFVVSCLPECCAILAASAMNAVVWKT